jgi:hypothetical protein
MPLKNRLKAQTMEKVTSTHTSSRKAEALNVRAGIMRLLKWDEQQYGEFQYDQGITYLQHYLKQDSHAADMLTRSRIFWNWWKNNWSNRDIALLQGAACTQVSTDAARLIYAELHDGCTLAAEIYPNGVVLGETYARMMGELINHETKSNAVQAK